MEKSAVEKLLGKLRETLPTCWDRKMTGKFTGELVNTRTLTNLMSAGEGPSGVVRHGRKRIIEKDGFLQWLKGRLEDDDLDGRPSANP
jgi:hypothetical protein